MKRSAGSGSLTAGSWQQGAGVGGLSQGPATAGPGRLKAVPTSASYEATGAASVSAFSSCLISFWPRSVLGPVLLEDVRHRLHDLHVVDDEADLAAHVQLEGAKALAADEHGVAVADHRAYVQAVTRQPLGTQVATAFADLADDADVDAGLCALMNQPDHLRVGELRVVDRQRFLCALDERGQLLAGIFGADDEALVERGLELLPADIGLEQPQRLLQRPCGLSSRGRSCGS